MPKKEIIADHNGSHIRVTNTWFGGAKLYVDGECKDTCKDAFPSPNSACMSAVAINNGEKSVIEIYIKAIFTVKIKVCVNGQQIGGDKF